jgi:uncharacterized protein
MTTTQTLTESTLRPESASYRHIVPAGDGWLHPLHKGQTLRILDLEGNQAVDTLFFSLNNPAGERYSAMHTIRAQGNVYLTTGSRLISSEGKPMLTIVADTCGRHDTLGGACAAESNQVRYALEKKSMHSCRDTFLHLLAECGYGIGKRELSSNINFFMNVPLTPDGGLTFEDGISGAGKYVEMRAEMDVLVLVSNCPQLNNPCNAYNPTPVEMLIWD